MPCTVNSCLYGLQESEFEVTLSQSGICRDILNRLVSALLGLEVGLPRVHACHSAVVETKLTRRYMSSQSSFAHLTVNTLALVLPCLTFPVVRVL